MNNCCPKCKVGKVSASAAILLGWNSAQNYQCPHTNLSSATFYSLNSFYNQPNLTSSPINRQPNLQASGIPQCEIQTNASTILPDSKLLNSTVQIGAKPSPKADLKTGAAVVPVQVPQNIPEPRSNPPTATQIHKPTTEEIKPKAPRPPSKKLESAPNKVKKYVQQNLKGSSRYLSHTAFRQLYGKQCYQNYGRTNTRGVGSGIVYGQYLRTHNINPHVLQKEPVYYQTQEHALRFAKNVIGKPVQEHWHRLVLKLSAKMGVRNPHQQFLFKQLDRLMKNKDCKSQLVQEIKYVLKECRTKGSIYPKRVEALDRRIEGYQEGNRLVNPRRSHYLVKDEVSPVVKHNCHNFLREGAQFEKREKESVQIQNKLVKK